jgi:hypothetical protein
MPRQLTLIILVGAGYDFGAGPLSFIAALSPILILY